MEQVIAPSGHGNFHRVSDAAMVDSFWCVVNCNISQPVPTDGGMREAQMAIPIGNLIKEANPQCLILSCLDISQGAPIGFGGAKYK